jgi:YVTN family beta-propeller protein
MRHLPAVHFAGRPSPKGRVQRAAVGLAVLAVAAGLPLAVAGPASAGTGYAVTATIGVGAGPAGVAVDPNNGTVYVANNSGNSVSAISETTNAVTATIPVGPAPVGVAVDPTAHSIWVANSAAGSASQISDATNTVTNTVSFPFGNPWGIAADPSTGTVYLSDTADGITDSIDEATGAGTYNVFGYGGTGIAVDPNNSNVYVVVNGSPGSAQSGRGDGAGRTHGGLAAVRHRLRLCRQQLLRGELQRRHGVSDQQGQ